MIRPVTANLSRLTILAVVCVVSPARAQQALDAQRVERGIQLAVRYLLSNQLDDGGWSEMAAYPEGVTSIVTLALLNSGVDPQNQQLSRALNRLASRQLEKTYTVSLQTMAFCAANPNKYATQIRRNAQWLADAQISHGGWSYDYKGGIGDPSNSQFALLALHEAQRAGVVDFPAARWKEIFGKAKSYWEGLQNGDGSFPYETRGPGRGSMTCAGIASLVIVGSQLEDAELAQSDSIRCCGEVPAEARIEAGMTWLARNFRVDANPGYAAYHLYYMYALERVGRLTGRRFIGEDDWYRKGSAQLLGLQVSITGEIKSPGIAQGNSFSETAFALLFLSKGKRQTVVSRLKYGSSSDWNQHPSAIQHLTAYTEQAWKRDLSWQNIDLEQATLADLLETPVLFFSGSRAPQLTAEHKQLLKDYVEQGGFILAEARNGDGCDGTAFEEYFRRLVVELFEQPLEKLSPDHPIWFAESRVTPADLPEGAWLYGVQTCCRLGVVYSPVPLSCRWQMNLPYGIRPAFPETVQRDLDVTTKLGVNVLSYATGKELKEKLESVTILEEVKPTTPTDRGVFILPKLQHNAGANDAPRAIPTMIQWLDKENPFRISSERRLIDITPQSLREYPVVFMHGRGELRLSESQRRDLREYLNNGGFLFADAICADELFAASFRREMENILDERLANLPETHPMLGTDYYGFDLRRVSVIDPDRTGEQIIAARRHVAPRLEVGSIESRIAVVFSPLDLSCALESRHSLQCRGYLREDAARIGINIILFALQQ